MRTRLFIYCEGGTEREFCNTLLIPFFKRKGIDAIVSTCTTSNTGGKVHKGGVSKYNKIRDEIRRIHRNPNLLITTMFDYYAFPKDAPGIATVTDVDGLERTIASDIGCDRVIFNLMKYEFEALLFSDVSAFKTQFPKAYPKLKEIKDRYGCPENINNSPQTAPSKRIYNLIPEYMKANDGIPIAETIGIETMMAECPHFKKWIETIINDERLGLHI